MKKDEEDGSHFARKHFAEDVGLVFEQEGMPRMAGRILGWLLICETPQTSLQELAEVLRASKGSISTMSRMLIQMRLAERVSLPGHRRDYVRLKPGSWSEWFAEEVAKISSMRELAERGLEMLDGKPASVRERLAEMRDLFAFLEQEYPLMLERWDAMRKRKKKA